MRIFGFIKKNLDVLLLSLFLQITEVLHLFFINNHTVVYVVKTHGETRNHYWDDIIYMVCAAFSCSVILPYVSLYNRTDKKLKSTRVLILGLLFYSIIEFIRLSIMVVNMVADMGINLDIIYIDNLYIGQLIYLNVLLILTYTLYIRNET